MSKREREREREGIVVPDIELNVGRKCAITSFFKDIEMR